MRRILTALFANHDVCLLEEPDFFFRVAANHGLAFLGGRDGRGARLAWAEGGAGSRGGKRVRSVGRRAGHHVGREGPKGERDRGVCFPNPGPCRMAGAGPKVDAAARPKKRVAR